MTKELKPFEFYRAYELILLRYKNVKSYWKKEMISKLMNITAN